MWLSETTERTVVGDEVGDVARRKLHRTSEAIFKNLWVRWEVFQKFQIYHLGMTNYDLNFKRMADSYVENRRTRVYVGAEGPKTLLEWINHDGDLHQGHKWLEVLNGQIWEICSR